MIKEKDRLNALEVALNNETREREFYIKNAKRTKNALGKKMFQQIGDDELEHYERLKQLHQKWAKQEKWPETSVFAPDDPELVEGVSRSKRRAGSSGQAAEGTVLGSVQAITASLAPGPEGEEIPGLG